MFRPRLTHVCGRPQRCCCDQIPAPAAGRWLTLHAAQAPPPGHVQSPARSPRRSGSVSPELDTILEDLPLVRPALPCVPALPWPAPAPVPQLLPLASRGQRTGSRASGRSPACGARHHQAAVCTMTSVHAQLSQPCRRGPGSSSWSACSCRSAPAPQPWTCKCAPCVRSSRAPPTSQVCSVCAVGLGAASGAWCRAGLPRSSRWLGGLAGLTAALVCRCPGALGAALACGRGDSSGCGDEAACGPQHRRCMTACAEPGEVHCPVSWCWAEALDQHCGVWSVAVTRGCQRPDQSRSVNLGQRSSGPQTAVMSPSVGKAALPEQIPHLAPSSHTLSSRTLPHAHTHGRTCRSARAAQLPPPALRSGQDLRRSHASSCRGVMQSCPPCSAQAPIPPECAASQWPPVAGKPAATCK